MRWRCSASARPSAWTENRNPHEISPSPRPARRLPHRHGDRPADRPGPRPRRRPLRDQGAGALRQQGSGPPARPGSGGGRAQPQLGSEQRPGRQEPGAGSAPPRSRRGRRRCRRPRPRRRPPASTAPLPGASAARPTRPVAGASAPRRRRGQRARTGAPGVAGGGRGGRRPVHLLRPGRRLRPHRRRRAAARPAAMLGVESRLTEREQGGRTVFRVRVGPFEKKEDADAAKEKLGRCRCRLGAGPGSTIRLRGHDPRPTRLLPRPGRAPVLGLAGTCRAAQGRPGPPKARTMSACSSRRRRRPARSR